MVCVEVFAGVFGLWPLRQPREFCTIPLSRTGDECALRIHRACCSDVEVAACSVQEVNEKEGVQVPALVPPLTRLGQRRVRRYLLVQVEE